MTEMPKSKTTSKDVTELKHKRTDYNYLRWVPNTWSKPNKLKIVVGSGADRQRQLFNNAFDRRDEHLQGTGWNFYKLWRSKESCISHFTNAWEKRITRKSVIVLAQKEVEKDEGTIMDGFQSNHKDKNDNNSSKDSSSTYDMKRSKESDEREINWGRTFLFP